MRAAGIIFNLVQMVIVLAIFVLQGLTFGGWTILGLFILLIIACFNLLVLLFHGLSDQNLIGGEKSLLVKRQDLRVAYRSGVQSVFAIGKQSFSVLDIAESGVRFSINRHEHIKKRFRARIELVCGETLNVKAIVVRRQADESAVRFKQPLGYAVLLKEKQAVAASDA
jgi:hypothetical protein